VEKNFDAVKNIRLAFRLIICRNPSVKEEQILKGYFDEQMIQFTSRKLDAGKTLQVGEYPINKKIDLNTSAALMKVIITIYNLEEAITKS
jgi:hypothetical protein